MSADSTPAPQPGPFWREHQARAVLALRELLTPARVRDILEGTDQPADFQAAVLELQRLQPGHSDVAIRCYRVLARECRADLRSLGWVDPRYADVLRHLCTYLEEAGWELRRDRWTPAPPWQVRDEPAALESALAALEATDGAAPVERSAFDLELPPAAKARLRRSLQRRRRRGDPPDAQPGA